MAVVDYLWGNTSKEEKKLIRKLGMPLPGFRLLHANCF